MSTAFPRNHSLSTNSPPPYAQQTLNTESFIIASSLHSLSITGNTNDIIATEATAERSNAEQEQHHNQEEPQRYHVNVNSSSSSNRRRPKHNRICYICKSRNLPRTAQDIGPYLIHRSQPTLILICPCLHRVHPTCLKEFGTADFICGQCNSIYRSGRFLRIARCICLMCHLLSLASTVGLIFGLSYLGRALDELGLGEEFGPKLDGDETWHDHEMLQIVEWLNMVHFATGVAGEALLGLVYLLGVCLVIGLNRTLIMISNILYFRLDALIRFHSIPKWIGIAFVCFCLFILGLVLGTYLLFFSWIWASVLHHIRKRIFEFNKEDFRQHREDKEKSLL
ncbi:hypothetical protein BDF20DRAFT_889952 [Mycotypha africana]|uniref:uncharacterized protein n=1 Tax=Mycotypha africana TaxID=64632 RepID=UPI0023019B2C|nr:uncharacterized protein BDF20DRAFT_889952 [Mycotypha africana]KAI8970219.1 hypothetical protein BDF20DRAFT_889952 [Mycotypha africana]